MIKGILKKDSRTSLEAKGEDKEKGTIVQRGEGTVWGLTKLNLQIMAAFKGPKADACWVLEPHL